MEPAVLINLMVELADLEEKLMTARAQADHHSRRDGHLAELQAEYNEDVSASAGEEKSAAARLRAAEGDIRVAEAALARKKDQVVGVSDRKQYRAIMAEIAVLETEINRCEDHALELLNTLESTGEKVIQARDDRDRQLVKGTAERDHLTAEGTAAAAMAGDLEKEIDRLEALLPVAIARHYARLRQQYPTGTVRVQDRACGGCFGQLPPQQALDAARGKALVRCPSCARFVVRHSWI